MTKIVIVSAFKGGVLKTTIASNLASLLSLKSKKVLLIDLDAQADIRIAFNVAEKENSLSIYDLLLNNKSFEQCIYKYNDYLDLLLSDEKMEDYEYNILTDLEKSNDYMSVLQNKLENNFKDYDYIIIDTAPSFSILTLQAYFLRFKDVETDIIIPFTPEIFSLKNLIRQINKINLFKKEFNNNLSVKAVIATKVMNNNTHKIIMNQTKQLLDVSRINFLNTNIKNTIKFSEYLITSNKPLSLEEDSCLSKELLKYKQIYKDILQELVYS